jgi:hypothetical protein
MAQLPYYLAAVALTVGILGLAGICFLLLLILV